MKKGYKTVALVPVDRERPVCGPLYRANRCLWEVKVVEVRSPVWKVPCAEYRWDTFSFVHGNLVCLEARDQGAECDTGDIHGIMAVGTARSGVSERGSRKCSPWIRLSCYCDVLKSASDFKTNLGASFERVTENKNMSPPQHSRLQGRIQRRIRASFPRWYSDRFDSGIHTQSGGKVALDVLQETAVFASTFSHVLQMAKVDIGVQVQFPVEQTGANPVTASPLKIPLYNAALSFIESSLPSTSFRSW